MLKITQEQLDKFVADYPGIIDSVLSFKCAELPHCPSCKSENTSSLQAGAIARTIAIASSTTKVKLVPNKTDNSTHHCNTCTSYFSES